VYDAEWRFVGVIVEIAKRARWADHERERRCEVKIDPACRKIINSHLNRFQAMIDAGQQPYEVISLTPWRGSKPRVPSREAIISETLKSYSPCSLTANDSELCAEGAWAERRAQRHRTR
jgi:hypothetical protein